MLFPEQVIHRLHRVESRQGHLHEDRRPVAHGAIPQAGKLQSPKLTAILALRRDEARGGVDMLQQVELAPPIVLYGAAQVHGIEMRAFLEHPHAILVGLVYLAAFQDLRTHCPVWIICKERTAARLAYIPHHATDTHGPVQFTAQVINQHAFVGTVHVVMADT